jgi:ATP-dependent exoDNAse (exonuclease V) beta subunit
LQFINNPDNDMLLAATLKSSLFNYSDKMMKEQLKKKRGATLWESIVKHKKQKNDVIDDETYDLLCKSIELSNKLPITNLIMKIVDESNWNYYYNTSETERDAVFRNLYKFMDFVRDVERRDYTTLTDLFLYLDKIFASDRMSEEYGNTTNSIKMSTIHSAKGLEYKHLILLDYEMQPSKRGGGNDRLTIDVDYGPKLKVPKSIDSFDNFGKANTFIDDYIDSIEDMKRKAENIRLSYVAMTRAKSSITIIPPLSRENQQDMWGEIFIGIGDVLEGQKELLKNKKGERTEFHKEVISREVNDSIDCYDTKTNQIVEIDCNYRVNFDFSETTETDETSEIMDIWKIKKNRKRGKRMKKQMCEFSET